MSRSVKQDYETARERELQARIDRVRELHHGNRWGFCEACSEHVDIPMPCPTRAALEPKP